MRRHLFVGLSELLNIVVRIKNEHNVLVTPNRPPTERRSDWSETLGPRPVLSRPTGVWSLILQDRVFITR